jgi:hypothetical protein
MKTTVQVELDDGEFPVELDFDSGRWSAEEQFDEGDFPFVAETGGKRYELFSNGTFAEEEE